MNLRRIWALTLVVLIAIVVSAPAKANEYINCNQLTRDISAAVLTIWELHGLEVTPSDQYQLMVWEHAVAAIKSGNPWAYIRGVQSNCFKVTT